jgi:hypothetical protein
MSTTPALDAESQAQITNLYARYNLHSDMGAPEAYAACFTADGAIRVQGLVVRDGVMSRGPGEFVVQGRADLIAFKRRDQAGRGGKYRRHWNGSLWLERVDADTVRGRCYLSAYNGEPGSLPVLAQTGVYEDTIVRAEGEWKFAVRRLSID